MARGRGGSGFSGGSGCDYCTSSLTLLGYNWKNSKVDGYFAIQIIAIVILLVCLGLMTQFKWTRQNGAKDTPRSVLYLIATISAIIFLIFNVVDIALSEEETETIYLYYLTYIFQGLFWRISEVLILLVVLKTAIESTVSRAIHKLSGLNIAAVILVALLTISSFGIYVAKYAYIFMDGPYAPYDHGNLEKSSYEVTIAYESLLLVAVIYGAIIGFITLVKERSLATLLLSILVIPALFLRTLLDLATNALFFSLEYGNGDYTKSAIDLNWADDFIYVIGMITIFLGLAIIGTLRPKTPNTAYNLQQQKHASYGNGMQVPVHY